MSRAVTAFVGGLNRPTERAEGHVSRLSLVLSTDKRRDTCGQATSWYTAEFPL